MVNVANFGIPRPGYYKDSLFVCKFFTSVQDFKLNSHYFKWIEYICQNFIIMVILDKSITRDELKELAENFYGDMIKGVVDVEQELLALDAELHSDLEGLLLREGSQQDVLWGINLYPEADEEDFLEFDSLINIRPRQGNRSRDVENEEIREKIRIIVGKYIA